MLNALTVDVEDYYQVSAFEHRVSRTDWDRWESRVVANTHRILDLFDEYKASGTFFVLGWVAERFPSLVREIDSRGHEIGSHSFWHRLIYTMTPEEFREDLRMSAQVIEAAIGRRVTLYRAPSFSITRESHWALDILSEEGFTHDSSVFPVRHDRYGMREAPTAPYTHESPCGRLVEFPPSTVQVAGVRLPVSGGGYFRLYPYWMTKAAASYLNRHGVPFMFYIHPWELDPQQPRVPGIGWKSRLRHRINLESTESKLRRLLTSTRFGPMTHSLRQASAMMHSNLPTALPTPESAVSA